MTPRGRCGWWLRVPSAPVSGHGGQAALAGTGGTWPAGAAAGVVGGGGSGGGVVGGVAGGVVGRKPRPPRGPAPAAPVAPTPLSSVLPPAGTVVQAEPFHSAA